MHELATFVLLSVAFLLLIGLGFVVVLVGLGIHDSFKP